MVSQNGRNVPRASATIQLPGRKCMKRVVIVFAILLAASLATAEDKFVSQGLGFELSVPEAPVSAAVYQVCLFYLPPADGFSSNVNVQIQEYAGSMQDYKVLSDNQFRQV